MDLNASDLKITFTTYIQSSSETVWYPGQGWWSGELKLVTKNTIHTYM